MLGSFVILYHVLHVNDKLFNISCLLQKEQMSNKTSRAFEISLNFCDGGGGFNKECIFSRTSLLSLDDPAPIFFLVVNVKKRTMQYEKKRLLVPLGNFCDIVGHSCVLVNGAIFVQFGIRKSSPSPLDTQIFQYNLQSGKWRSFSINPALPRRSHHSFTVIDNNIVLSGGLFSDQTCSHQIVQLSIIARM